AFELDLAAPSVTCPAGQTTTTVHPKHDEQGRPVLQFTFPRAVCEACALFARCVHSKVDGRTITSHYTGTHRQVRCYEGLLRAARAQQATPEFKDAYRRRAAVERKIADLVAHGLRRARYLGRVKVRLQNYGVAAV